MTLPRRWNQHFDRQVAEDQQRRHRELRRRDLVPSGARSFEDMERRNHQDISRLTDEDIAAEAFLLTAELSTLVFNRERGDREWLVERIGLLRRETAGRQRKGRAA